MAWWIRWTTWLDYALLLRVAARAPRWLGLPWAVWRGCVNAALDADWRTISLGQRYVRQATLRTMRAWCAKNNIHSIWMPAWLTLRRFVHASVEELDALQLARLSRWPRWSANGLEGLQAELARGQGVVLLTAHFDSLYMGLAWLARQGVKVHVVSTRLVHDKRIPPAIARHFADKIDAMDGLLKPGGVFDVEGNVRALVRALKAGGVVVIAADGPASTSERATRARFWGEDCLMAPGPEFLARSAGALVGSYMSWWEGGRLKVEISEPTALGHGGMQRAMDTMAAVLFRMPWRWWACDLMQTYRPAPPASEWAPPR